MSRSFLSLGSAGPVLGLAACLAFGLLSLAEGALAQAHQPLVQDGTTSIPQRVLSRPDAVVTDAPGSSGEVERPDPFSLYYVFAREDHQGAQWIEVGPNRDQAPVGWLPADGSVDWKQTLVLTFTNPADRLPALFFDDRDTLIDFVEDERLPVLAPDYVSQTRAGTPPDGAGIVSIEGEDFIDFKEQFYLLPILDAEEVFLSAAGRRAKIFEIASIPLSEEEETPPPETDDFPVGLVFVIDTTISMDPYIDRTREAVRTIFDNIKGSEIGERVSFGMVGFRGNTEGAEGLGYTSKVFAPLSSDFDPEEFLQQIQQMDAATASSRGFNEDGLAGVVSALELEAWKDFGGRFIVFISDAGVREPPDPLATTGMTVDQVNAASRDRQIAVISLLLQTPIGSAYHARAEDQLRRLSFWREGWAAPFYSVPDGALDSFGPMIDELTSNIVAQVTAMATPPFAEEQQSGDESEGQGGACADSGNAIGCLGYAMRLAWLGRTTGAQAPSVFRAWTPQFALDDPLNGRSFDVRILLNRNQVNNLYARLGLVLEAANQVIGEDPGLFFDVLQTVIAQATNDPSTLEDLDPSQAIELEVSELPNLGALLGEYFGHLPFKTRLMRADRAEWDRMEGGERDQILTSVRSARQLLKFYYQDVDNWIALHPQATDGEKVYPLPLEVLP